MATNPTSLYLHVMVGEVCFNISEEVGMQTKLISKIKRKQNFKYTSTFETN